MPRRAVRALLVSGLGLLWPAPASAFCRTTTVHEPVPYDPVASGCWTQGTPLAWAGGQSIAYSLSKAASTEISLADATTVADLAFGAWNAVQCTGGGVPNVRTHDGGPVAADAAANDCGLQSCDPTVHDPQHVIVFDDASWPFNDPNNTLAMTTVTYGIDSGEIFDADVQINSSQHTITVAEPPPANTYDLRAILTHEAGHFLGLAHATSDAPVMYAKYRPGFFTLSRDDQDGLCSAYPPVDAKGGCACDAAPRGGGGWAVVAGALFLAGAAGRRRARATRTRDDD